MALFMLRLELAIFKRNVPLWVVVKQGTAKFLGVTNCQQNVCILRMTVLLQETLTWTYSVYLDIIHCVGPVGEKADLLMGCYKSALDTLLANNLRSIAFPCISTGVYGYPNENAAHVALKTVRTWLEDSTKHSLIDRVIFCLFLDKDVDVYNRLLPRYFPTN